ncbi:MAG: hypothetical protein IPO41_04040 [Acidobacteria bacterium]|nr:hypothetical protein [Acidobacteriota bacterium]
MKELAENLIKAQNENDLPAMIRIANILQEQFEPAYYNQPFVFNDPIVRKARLIVRKLQRAECLKKKKKKK